MAVHKVVATGDEAPFQLIAAAGAPAGGVTWRRIITARDGALVDPDRPERGQVVIILTMP